MPNPAASRPAARLEETPPERRARQLDMLRELAELNMIAARDAAQRIEAAGPDTPEAATPTLALARATRAVTQIIAAENRVAEGELAASRAVHDPRRDTLRQTLAPLARDTDPARRAERRRQIDLAIDDALDPELDDDLPLGPLAVAIAHKLDLPLDLATLPDHLLGLPPRIYASPFRTHDDAARAPP